MWNILTTLHGLTTIKDLIPLSPLAARLHLLLQQDGQSLSRVSSSVQSRTTASKPFVCRTPCSLHAWLFVRLG
jgi:hypothetical protein